MDITKRQSLLLSFVRDNPNTQTQDIREWMIKSLEKEISRITIIRDLEVLLKEGFIEKSGSGRSVTYQVTVSGKLIAPVFDYESYFERSPEQRISAFATFQFDIFDSIHTLFSSDELTSLENINDEYREKLTRFSPVALKKEFERLTVELSWKSSQMEGNTYSLIDTEILLTQEKEAVGHKKEEAVMLLNHKRALEYIYKYTENFEKISIHNIADIHTLIVEGLGMTKGLRKNMVGITGTVYRPIDNEFQIREAVERMIETVNACTHPLEKALTFILLLSYIQPFEDGNKRTARLVGNAILMAHNYCPLSYRSVDEAEYKKAILLFYEKNSVWLFKKIFLDQFKFATQNYFLA